jgi:hypothetical protein
VAVNLGPKRFRLLPLPLPRSGEPHSADPLILFVSCFDPHQTIPLQGPEIPGERGPIHSHEVRQHRERLRAEAVEHGEDGELTREEPRRSERSLIGLGYRPGGSAQVEADAGGGGGELGGHESVGLGGQGGRGGQSEPIWHKVYIHVLAKTRNLVRPVRRVRPVRDEAIASKRHWLTYADARRAWARHRANPLRPNVLDGI